MSGSTIVKYQGTALPIQNTAVDLFNSVTAFPPGGSFHLLGQQWLQYAVRFDGASGSITGTVIGQYSIDKGVNWVTFYTSATFNDDVINRDEVYVGMYKDVRFRFTVTNATEDSNLFEAQVSLHCAKPTSKAATTDTLGGNA